MAVIDGFRQIVWDTRNIPGTFGLRPHTVEVGLGAWSGTNTGGGQPTITWTPIVESGGQNPKVRKLSDEEIAVGALGSGSVRIGPITPDFPGGGTSSATLMADAATTGQTRHVRITGPEHPTGALYVIHSADFTASLHYYLVCQPVSALVAPAGDTLTEGGDTLVDGGVILEPT